MGMAVPVYYSAEMVRTLPDDGKRYETVHGELLVAPAPRAWHQEITARLHLALRGYLEQHPIGHAFHSPADISWSDDTLVQPDVFVVRIDEARSMDWRKMQSLLLVIEVLSPTTARFDRFTKRRLYQEVSIPAYWIVDPDNAFVEVWEPQTEFPGIERERVTWQPEGVDDGLEIVLADLFKPI
jgi:Uma2 family endonuclease